MAVEVQAVDADAEALRQQVEQEAALARTHGGAVTIPRRASAALAAEAERRIASGVYPSAGPWSARRSPRRSQGGVHETVFCCRMRHGISGSRP